jgi:hypothetical protein
MKNNVIKKPEYPCSFCKRREATQFCDFVFDYQGTIFMSERDGGIQAPSPVTCDNEICSECAAKYNGHDFCPSCESLRKQLKLAHDKRHGKLMMDGAMGRTGGDH